MNDGAFSPFYFYLDMCTIIAVMLPLLIKYNKNLWNKHEWLLCTNKAKYQAESEIIICDCKIKAEETKKTKAKNVLSL